MASAEHPWDALELEDKMDRSREPIQRFMSPAPMSVQPEAKLAEAARLMEDNDIRHLPVVQNGKVVGVVSERDLAIAESLVPNEWEDFPVAEAMTPDPHTVSPETLVSEVAHVMAEHKHGSVLVVDRAGKLLGIFTTTDALRVLAGGR
jgi:acetoin utilization protein AcuB